MHFNVLNYLLILLLLSKLLESKRIFENAHGSDLLDEVSDFDDIVEIDSELNSNQHREGQESIKVVRDNQKLSHEVFGEYAAPSSIFSSPSLSDEEVTLNRRDNNDHKDSIIVPIKIESESREKEVEVAKEKTPDKFRLLSKGNEIEKPKTVVIKEHSLPNKLLLETKRPYYKEILNDTNVDSQEAIPDYVYDFDNTQENCKDCKNIKNLFPIPLLESILINRLLEENRDKSKPYPLKYIVKTVLPNFKSVDELDNPQNANYLKNYLFRRKRQLEYLKKRSNRHKKRKKVRKKKRKKKRLKGRHHRSAIDPNNEINSMLEYVAKNQTFNETYTYMPLLFGTVSPAENQMLVAGVNHNASIEEKIMLQKILALHSANGSIPAGNITTISSISSENISQIYSNDHPSTISIQNTSMPQNNSLTTVGSSVVTTEINTTYNLNLNLNVPEVKKTFMEIMRRQQNFGSFEATSNRIKRDAETSPIPTSSGSFTELNTTGTNTLTNSSHSSEATQKINSTENGTLGLIVTSPSSPQQINEIPGILIYPKSPKQHKRFANTGSDDSVNRILNQAGLNDILKSMENTQIIDVTVEIPKFKKECKTDKCTEETDKIMDMLNSLNQEGIKNDENDSLYYSTASSRRAPINPTTQSEPGAGFNNESSTSTLTSTINNNEPKNGVKVNTELRDKLSRLQKDLKMVDEIQNIFNAVAISRKGHQAKKRRILTEKIKRRIKDQDTETETNKYENELSGLIKARIMIKNMKNRSGISGDKNSFGNSRVRRFLAMEKQNLQ